MKHLPHLAALATLLLATRQADGDGLALLNQMNHAHAAQFGRMPFSQKGAKGRDHNPDGFTCWMTGAGVKPGVSHGMTDELGQKAIEDIHPLYHFNATILHLLGLDFESPASSTTASSAGSRMSKGKQSAKFWREMSDASRNHDAHDCAGRICDRLPRRLQELRSRW